MSGVSIGVLTHETGRYAEFWEHLFKLNLPEGSVVSALYGADIARARNTMIQLAIKADHDAVWFIDDDHAWPVTDILQRLLAHQVDMVQPIVLRPRMPYLPVVSRLNDKGAYMPLTLEELGTGGLAPVVACGMGARRGTVSWSLPGIVPDEQAKEYR